MHALEQNDKKTNTWIRCVGFCVETPKIEITAIEECNGTKHTHTHSQTGLCIVCAMPVHVEEKSKGIQ